MRAVTYHGKRDVRKECALSSTQEAGQITGTRDKDCHVIWFTEQCLRRVTAGRRRLTGGRPTVTEGAAPGWS